MPNSVHGCWQQMLVTFLEELHAQVPDDDAIPSAAERARTEPVADLMKELVAALAPRHGIVMTNNPALFDGLVLMGIDFQAIWARDIAPESRAACHQYISMLYLLANTISTIPPQLLSTIEGVAQTMASSITQDGQDIPDMSSLLGALAGGGGAGGLASLLGSSMSSLLGGALAEPAEDVSPPLGARRRLPFSEAEPEFEETDAAVAAPPRAPTKVAGSRRNCPRKPKTTKKKK